VSVTPIRLMGDPVLRQKAEPVVDFDRELQQLVADLTDTMHSAGGAGLAAPQIGVGLRVFATAPELPGNDLKLDHLINPVLTFPDEDTQDGFEGCLSIPGIYLDTRRRLNVVAKGFTEHGDPVQVVGEGLLSRCIQHETDHLDGILFIDRMSPEQRKLAMKAIREAEWSGLAEPVVKISPHATRGLAV
jgi:peptide deformylase